MKNFLIFISVLILGLSALAQVPLGINYQTIIRDGNNAVFSNAEISLMLSIRFSETDGEIVYSEIHNLTTNDFGLVNLVIGEGELQAGNFTEINWGSGNHFLETAVDFDGNSNFSVLGITQFLTVPYANFSSNGIKTMTREERDALENPFPGMQIYNSTTNCLNYFSGYAWFETCGDCTPLPSQAFAGNDTVVTDGTTAIELSGNVPQEGNGVWSVLSGGGGSFEDNTNHNTIFTGLLQIEYILQWAIGTACDTTYDQVSVTFFDIECSEPIFDPRDGKIYEVVLIGFQCWMAENLNVGDLLDGQINQSDNDTIEKYCYGNNQDNCDEFGGLYQWDEMMQYVTTENAQGICPDGWHIPTDDDWCALENVVDTTIVCLDEDWRGTDGGTKLKEGGSSGFEILPSGFRDSEGNFLFQYFSSGFWSSNEFDDLEAWGRSFAVPIDMVGRGHLDKNFGFPVRCLKDN